jgi:hypothetical protein
MAILKNGEGYLAVWGRYRLFVEVEVEGWTARLRDSTDERWVWKEDVEDASAGKVLAEQKLTDYLSSEEVGRIRQEGLKWTHYGQ